MLSSSKTQLSLQANSFYSHCGYKINTFFLPPVHDLSFSVLKAVYVPTVSLAVQDFLSLNMVTWPQKSLKDQYLAPD